MAKNKTRKAKVKDTPCPDCAEKGIEALFAGTQGVKTHQKWMHNKMSRKIRMLATRRVADARILRNKEIKVVGARQIPSTAVAATPPEKKRGDKPKPQRRSTPSRKTVTTAIVVGDAPPPGTIMRTLLAVEKYHRECLEAARVLIRNGVWNAT